MGHTGRAATRYTAAVLGMLALTGAAQAQAQAQAIAQRAPAGFAQPAAMADLRGAIRQTAAVVEGLASDIRHEYTEEDGPWTVVTLTGVKTHFGQASDTVEIRHFGGPTPNGRMVVAAELPVFVKDKRYLVFLRNTAWNLSPVVGDLALRVESQGGSELLVDSDGRAVTGVGAKGVSLGAALFEGPQIDGSAPKALASVAAASASQQALRPETLVRQLGQNLAAQGLKVEGSFLTRPAGAFKWRAVQVAARPGRQAAGTPMTARTAASTPAAAERDTSGTTSR